MLKLLSITTRIVKPSFRFAGAIQRAASTKSYCKSPPKINTFNLAKLKEDCRSWKPCSLQVGDEVMRKIVVTNRYMKQFRKFLNNPTKRAFKQSCKSINRRYKFANFKPGKKLPADFLEQSLLKGHVSELPIIGAKIFHCLFVLVLRHPEKDYRKLVQRITRWSSRKQRNFKVGERILRELVSLIRNPS